MLVETACAVTVGLTLCLDALNNFKDKRRQEKLHQKVVLRDGAKIATIEAYTAEMLFSVEDLVVLNNPKSSKMEKAAAYVRSQEYAEAFPNWKG